MLLLWPRYIFSVYAAQYITANWAGYVFYSKSDSGYAPIYLASGYSIVTPVFLPNVSVYPDAGIGVSVWVGISNAIGGSQIELVQGGWAAFYFPNINNFVYFTWYEFYPSEPMIPIKLVTIYDTVYMWIYVYKDSSTGEDNGMICIWVPDWLYSICKYKTLSVPLQEMIYADFILETPYNSTASDYMVLPVFSNYRGITLGNVTVTFTNSTTFYGSWFIVNDSYHSIILEQGNVINAYAVYETNYERIVFVYVSSER
ncbi:hypothetical protein Pyrfu_1051 [Pyrolobus fumarii 1A]|uniref:Uncharacterized protein n=1 Tax=Pyrolobus fumarii (strain DSM 11204 / 1A) TaxID=694429 RepID=G0EF22_PYRF1|nr:hypothetical protein Pyrfu_1051 [Pyrolobus fumarii 1A]